MTGRALIAVGLSALALFGAAPDAGMAAAPGRAPGASDRLTAATAAPLAAAPALAPSRSRALPFTTLDLALLAGGVAVPVLLGVVVIALMRRPPATARGRRRSERPAPQHAAVAGR